MEGLQLTMEDVVILKNYVEVLILRFPDFYIKFES